MRYSDLWTVELHKPTPPDRRLDRPTEPAQMTGFWRLTAAKTKPDYPVCIWIKDGETAAIFQIGRKMRNTAEHAAEWAEFCEGSWLKCVAVSYEEWAAALETGRWSDGKPARQMTEEEKLGIAPAAEGSNNPPAEESLADQIKALAEKIEKRPEPTTQDEANALTGDLDRLRGLLKLAEAERVKEKEPHLTASREVDAKWGRVTLPGEGAYKNGDARRKAFLLKEQRKREEQARIENERRRKEAEEAARIERERIAAETAERLRKEAEERAKAGEAETPTTEEIAAKAAEIAAAQVEAPQVEEVKAERVTAGSAFGTSRGLRMVKKGRILDMSKFRNAGAIATNTDLIELLHKLADRAAKAGIAIDGMEIIEVAQ